MSGLPKLRKDRNILIQAKYSADNVDSIACVLTCLSVEASRNDLTSMSYVLTELANGLCESAGNIDTLVRYVERQQENKDEQDKKD